MQTKKSPVVKLLPQREQSWLFGHPWIYSRAIQHIPSVEPGTVVHVHDHLDQFIGVGYLHPKQTIAIRMLDSTPTAIDRNWFLKKLRLLDNYRQTFLGKDTTAYRLCHGESDGMPGLAIDRYENVAVVQINTKGMERLLPLLLTVLPELGIAQWMVQGDSVSGKREGVRIDPSLSTVSDEVVWACENGLKICIPIRGGQKTGWFCDQRDNRLEIKRLVSSQKLSSLLNLFSYTGGFSLSGLAGGAKRVLNVDQDKKALDLFEAMSGKNHFSAQEPSLNINVWEYLSSATETFDLVIVDPPAFAKEESKKTAALKGYKDLFKQSVLRVACGGFLVVFSCSHFIKDDDLQWVLRQVFIETKRRFQTIRPLSQGFDHPVPAWFQEGKYLKGYLLKEFV